jgi:hypothetical protein
MGYRIDITSKNNPKLNYYGTKYYGYKFDMICELEKNEIPSVTYLLELGKFDEDTTFFDCDENEIELTADEFKHFIELYSKEWEKIGKTSLIELPSIKALIEDTGNKIIKWG